MMVQKTLRSQIHENFSLDSRVELSILQKRRDIVNKEKQTELFNILRKYNIDAIPVGPGTNRYCFKLNGYAVKFATNNDGRIDNFKEFKMSPVLQPDVIKCYEISEDGILLFTEYIQPFDSFTEMMKYESQIKRILERLSEIFFIGDVGLVQKNYANWGMRIGSDIPVCLDFAYVYDVSSELFLCKACNRNSVLVSTSNFAQLKCPACGRLYQFEDIRRKIGNDLHNHEIGNLRDIGYVLTESNITQVLDERRSRYLSYNKKDIDEPKVVVKEKPKFIDDFHL